MRQTLTLWAILVMSVAHGVSYYLETSHIPVMSLVFSVVAILGLTAKE
jgi:uncharacterized BrkB/YihY/UPF0761 family membrane protein